MPFKYNALLGLGLDNTIPLDGAGKIPSTFLPSYVDDVEEYNNLAAFPATGETGKIYVAINTGFVYRWSGSVYVQIGITAAAGSTTQVQFNDGGAFGGDSGLTFDKTTDALSAGGFIPTSSTVPTNGVYLPAANSVGVATNGTGRLYIGATGNVDINSTTTGLSISTSILGGVGSAISTLNARGAGLGTLTLQTEGTERLRITSAGRVGVGNTNPQALFSVGSSSTDLAVPSGNFAAIRGGGYASASTAGIQLSGGFGNSGTIGAFNIKTVTAGTGGTISNALAITTTTAFDNVESERLRITSAGLVGIGTSSPASLLHLSSATGSATPTPAEIRIQSTTNAADWSTTDPWGRISFFTSDVSSSGPKIEASIDAVKNTSSGASTGLFFKTWDAGALNNVMVLANTGQVGIGTTSPGSALEINAAAATSPFIAKINTAEVARIDSSGSLLLGTSTSRTIAGSVATNRLQIESPNSGIAGFSIITNRGDNLGPVIYFGKSRGPANGGTTIVADGDILGEIRFAGTDGTDIESTGARIIASVDGTPGANDMPGMLRFLTSADGSATPTERLRITSAGVLQVADAGNITVGTTTGTKIGTATTQKIGFYNATPVVQPAAVADATDAVDVITQLNDLLAKLRTLGIIAT